MSNPKCSDGVKDNVGIYDLSGSISPVVEKCISGIIEKEGFLFYNVNVKDITTNGGNYLAALQELDLKGKNATGDKEINLFLKNRLSADDFDIFPLDEVYNREAFYYNELVKVYNRLQDDANIPNEERFKMAKSYGESNSDVTILDNLTKKGYISYDRLEAVTIDFAEKAVKQVAKFHALSYVLKEKMPVYFDESIKTLKPLINVDSDWKKLIGTLFVEALEHLEGESRRKMVSFLPSLIDSYLKFVIRTDEDAICLCHGDFRPNNTMLIQKDDKIEDLLLVDFQLINCGNQIYDFIYFIFMGSDQKFRKAHLDELKDIYYDTFSAFLKYFGIYSEDVYTRKNFDDDFYEYLNFGLSSGLLGIPFICCDNEDIPDINTLVKETKFKWNARGKQRWREMVEDFIVLKKM